MLKCQALTKKGHFVFHQCLMKRVFSLPVIRWSRGGRWMPCNVGWNNFVQNSAGEKVYCPTTLCALLLYIKGKRTLWLVVVSDTSVKWSCSILFYVHEYVNIKLWMLKFVLIKFSYGDGQTQPYKILLTTFGTINSTKDEIKIAIIVITIFGFWC